METLIIEKYKNSNSSLEDLCKEFKIGKLKLKKILKDNNVDIRKKGGQIKYLNKDNVVKIDPHTLECKKCKKTFNDYENKSGSITNHIKECYPDVIIPSSFKRRMFLKENGYHFHSDFFIKKEIEEIEKLKCPLCEWETNDLTNKTGSFTKHIDKTHGSISEFIENNPDYEIFFNTLKKNVERNTLFEDVGNFTTCMICNEKLKILSNTHLKLHDITQEEYKNLYGREILSNNLHKKFVDQLNDIELGVYYRSQSENEISEFISGLGLNILVNNKSVLNGTELDIFIPDHNMAIEYNGLYWHSEKRGKTKTYHIDKTKKCLNKNIRLIHIFSDEWSNKKNIIKERLKIILNFNRSKIYARNCKVIELTNEQKKDFLNKNHLQGNDKSSIFYGLEHNKELVSVITFGKLRNSLGHKNIKDGEFEIYRYCNLNVIGGFSKLLKYFIKIHSPKKIITYADRNWSPSDEFCFYSKMGFNFVGETKPNYSYTKNYSIRYHRYNFRKDKLVSMGYDKTKTENEIMYELGFDKIWDTGNLKYELVVI
jgi:hypothetical protein